MIWVKKLPKMCMIISMINLNISKDEVKNGIIMYYLLSLSTG